MTPTLKKIASNDQLPSQADVVVIGGGIIGACASYFLAKQGYSVALIEKGLVSPDVTQFTPETIKAATVIVTILPILFAYPFVQKYFVKGITLGGVKE